MNETVDLLKAWREAEAAGEDAVLATVVHVRGSAYRRPGTRMLIRRDGRRTGTISGGCLEADLARKAWWLTEAGRALRTYDTRSDDDAEVAFGLGCNGVIQVVLERTSSVRARLEAVENVFRSGQAAVLLTPVSGEAISVSSHVEACRRTHQSRLVHAGGATMFVEWCAPPQRLVIFGTGHDSVPLASIAAELGWDVLVKAPQSGVSFDADTAVVLMTHNYAQDQMLLPRVLSARPRYIGILGPRKRTERLFQDIGAKLADYPVHAPIGLDVGADTPAAVALAIAAEIQSVLCGRAGGMLKHRDAPIHAPAFESGVAAGLSLQTPPVMAYCENA